MRVAVDSSRTDSSTLRAITGIATLSSKLPLAPATVTAASLPITCMQTIRVASGSTGLTLPGMMLEPGCRSGRWISASPVVGPDAHPAQVVADLGQPDRDRAQHAAQLDERVAGALGLEVVAGLGELLTGGVVQRLDRGACEPGRGVDAGADGGAAERQLAHPGEHGFESLDGVPDGGGVPAELLARASPASRPSGGCARTSPGRRTRPPSPPATTRAGRAPAAGRRPRPSAAATWMAVGNVSLLDWLAFTWSLGWTSTPAAAAERGDHLVGVHVGAGARAGLEDVDRELVVVLAVGHLPCGGRRSRRPPVGRGHRASRWRSPRPP